MIQLNTIKIGNEYKGILSYKLVFNEELICDNDDTIDYEIRILNDQNNIIHYSCKQEVYCKTQGVLKYTIFSITEDTKYVFIIEAKCEYINNMVKFFEMENLIDECIFSDFENKGENEIKLEIKKLKDKI